MKKNHEIEEWCWTTWLTQVFEIHSHLVQLTFASVPFIWTHFWIIWARWKICQNRSQAIMKLKRDAKNCLKSQVFQIHSNLVQLTFASVPFIWTQFWIIRARWKIHQNRSQAIMKLKRDAKNCLKTQVFQIHSNLVQLTFASVPFIWTQFWIIWARWKFHQNRSQAIMKQKLDLINVWKLKSSKSSQTWYN